MESYFEIINRDGQDYLVEKELIIKEERLLEEGSREQLVGQIEEAVEKLNKLYAIDKAFVVRDRTIELSKEEFTEEVEVDEQEQE